MIKNKFNIGQKVIAIANNVATELVVRSILPGDKKNTLVYDLYNALGSDLKPNSEYYNERPSSSPVVRYTLFPENVIFADEADFRKNVIIERLPKKED